MSTIRSGDSPTTGNWPVEKLPGIQNEDCQRLHQGGIQTTQQLLQHATRDMDDLAAQVKIPVKKIRKWAALADLARIPGVGCDRCGLLLHCGIINAAQLGQTPIHKLYPQLQRLSVATTRRRDFCPPRGEVIRWIQSARQLASR